MNNEHIKSKARNGIFTQKIHKLIYNKVLHTGSKVTKRDLSIYLFLYRQNKETYLNNSGEQIYR